MACIVCKGATSARAGGVFVLLPRSRAEVKMKLSPHSLEATTNQLTRWFNTHFFCFVTDLIQHAFLYHRHEHEHYHPRFGNERLLGCWPCPTCPRFSQMFRLQSRISQSPSAGGSHLISWRIKCYHKCFNPSHDACKFSALWYLGANIFGLETW